MDIIKINRSEGTSRTLFRFNNGCEGVSINDIIQIIGSEGASIRGIIKIISEGA